jgi:pimeloyl-ACP methyl ester carboxylesterase
LILCGGLLLLTPAVVRVFAAEGSELSFNPDPSRLATSTTRLWLPESVRPAQPPRAIIAIADYGGGARCFTDSRWRSLAQDERLALVLHKFIERGPRPALGKEPGARAALTLHLDEHARRTGIAALGRAPLVLVGTSQAGAQAFAFAWHAPDRCAAVVQLQSAVASVQWWTRPRFADEKVRDLPMLYLIGGRDAIGAANHEPHACSRILLRQFIGPAVAAGAKWSACLKAEEVHGGFGDQSFTLAWLREVLSQRLAGNGPLRPLPQGLAAALEWKVNERNADFQEPVRLVTGAPSINDFRQRLWFPNRNLAEEAARFMNIPLAPGP